MTQVFDADTRAYMKKIGTGVEFSKIRQGDTYHIPPLSGIGRKTVLVEEVEPTRIKCMIEDCYGYVRSEWIYDFELQSKYLLPYKYELNK